MRRLTHERSSIIKGGYWSLERRDDLVQALAAYENTGYSPEEIKRLKIALRSILNAVRPMPAMAHDWIPVEKQLPENDQYILLSFENFSMPQIGRYEVDDEGGAFYVGNDAESCISQDLIVNAWMPLPEPYKAKRLPEDWKRHIESRFEKVN